ncbi:MAG TPA: dihydroorotase [Candidatus Obscuribacterales bacterium]
MSAERAGNSANNRNVLLKGGRLINPSNGAQAPKSSLLNNQIVDVRVKDGMIAEISSNLDARDDEITFDASGLMVLPGFIDLHTHLRDLGQSDREDIRTGTLAAAAGGFTTVVAMANTEPPTDCADILGRVLKRIQERAVIEVLPVANVTRGMAGSELTNMVELAEMGAIAFSDDGKPISNLGVLRRALEYAKLADRPIISHPEDMDLSHGGSMNESPFATGCGIKGIPTASEAACVAREIEVVRFVGGRLHFAHISAAASVDLIRQAKAQGLAVSADATPHHLVLADEDIPDYDTAYKMNPPLRSRHDQAAVLKALEEGVIDAIATDHAPHSKLDKSKPFDQAPFGIIGLETAFPLLFEKLVLSGKMPPPAFIALLTSHPASIIKRECPMIATGQKANLAIVDTELRWHYDVNRSQSKSRNSPFDGKPLRSKIIATFYRGRMVHVDQEHAARRCELSALSCV